MFTATRKALWTPLRRVAAAGGGGGGSSETWDTAYSYAPGVVFSGGDLKATSTATDNTNVRSLHAVSADGDYYTEFDLGSATIAAYKIYLGVCNASLGFGNLSLNDVNATAAYYDGIVAKNSVVLGTGPTYAANAVIGMRAHLAGATRELYYYKDVSGTWTAYGPFAVPAGALHALLGLTSNSDGSFVTQNFGASAYLNTLVSGWSNWS